MTRIHYGKRLKMLRIHYGLKLKDVAKYLNVSSSTVSYTESNLDDTKLVMRYLKYLFENGVDLNALFKDYYIEDENKNKKTE